jgi:hypothetical protein
MNRYKLTLYPNTIIRLLDNSTIPTDLANTDYANFKAQINADEAQLEDVDGNLMTAIQAKEYVATLLLKESLEKQPETVN